MRIRIKISDGEMKDVSKFIKTAKSIYPQYNFTIEMTNDRKYNVIEDGAPEGFIPFIIDFILYKMKTPSDMDPKKS